MTDPRGGAAAVGAAAFAAGLAIVLLSTRGGVGVSPDSVQYVSMARGLLAGKGYVDRFGAPVTLFPFLYPTMLAAVHAVGVGFTTAARLLGAVAFGLTAALASSMVFAATRNRMAAAIAAIVLLTIPQIAAVFSWAWSEAPYTVLVMACLALLSRFLTGRRRSDLLLAAGVAALAFVTRYAGAILVATGVGLLLRRSGPIRGRLRDASLFAGLAVVPFAAWVARNVIHAGSALGRGGGVHPPGFGQSLRGLAVPASWFVTRRVPVPVRAGLTLAAIALLLGLYELTRRRRGLSPAEPRAAAADAVVQAFGSFALAHVVGLFLIVTFGDAFVALDSRMFSVALPPAVVAATVIGWRGARTLGEGRLLALLAIPLSVSIVFNVVRTGALLAHGNRGIGYESRAWRSSPLVALVGTLPRSTRIVTNEPDALWWLLGRRAHFLPFKFDPHTEEPNPEYGDQIRALGQRLRGGGVVAFFHEYLTFTAAEDEILRAPGLVVRARVADGILLGSAADGPPSG